jgi:hypothetical protein
MVELAMTLTLALMVLIVTIQFAIIGDAALAVTQLAYAGARYAAVNPTYNQSTIATYMKSIASPAISDIQTTDIAVTPDVTPSTPQRTFGTSVQVSVVYQLKNKLFLPNPFLGISFPTTLSGIQTTMMSE